ncbi:ADP-ribose pyrophosphatase YjhB, NUDIX family [Cohaesibacter sp. ES.047]|uniref:NUDIX hydrolase n=1 Tax=Cohaesibacter sp. ES.047 TaxID=1798205 RepID=UPI000BB95167|nr:NUDIX hydrolase [Cohaesibacter sp. ES.047]SNY92425.1 ADP-ribose pyrophosphatase YjhB, NUDIX family [Cohaesibacter sp. ES.047]
MATSRSYPDHPFLGVSALIRSGDHVLLIERGNPPLAGEWSLPGGTVETGESLEEAIQREILEETGLDFTPKGVGELVEVILHDEEARCSRHFVIAVFVGHPSALDLPLPILSAGDDARQALWVPLDQVKTYPLTDGTIDVINRLVNGGKRIYLPA